MFMDILSSALAIGGAIDQREQQRTQFHENQDFQREMSNTAYQRAMTDMQKAGLNPMLVAKLGGASTPGGGAVGSPPNIGNAIIEGVSSAAGTRNKDAQTELTKGQTDLLKAQADNIRADTQAKLGSAGQAAEMIKRLQEEVEQLKLRRPVASFEGSQGKAREDAWKGRSGVEEKYDADTDSWSRKPFSPADDELRKLTGEADAAEVVKENMDARTKEALSRALLNELDVPRGRAEAAMFSHSLGKYIPWVREGSRAISSAADIVDVIRRWRGIDIEDIIERDWSSDKDGGSSYERRRRKGR